MHALREFVNDHPDIDQLWYTNSNFLGWLSTSDESALISLLTKAAEQGIRHSSFREPDIGDRITAIALEPGEKTSKLCANLQLALRS